MTPIQLCDHDEAKDGGPPPIRKRLSGQIRGSPDCPPAHRKELRESNELASRTCGIIRAASEAGTEYIIENPADRGDAARPHLFIHSEHAPLWLMPEITDLGVFCEC